MGFEVATAHDGLQAVEVANAFHPAVILLDIGMPGLNGYEACRRIHQEPWSSASTFIALTGWGKDEDRERSRAAGFDHHLVKPVDPVALKTLLQQATANANAQPRHGILDRAAP
jgi:CheY-like chemotaxis protein